MTMARAGHIAVLLPNGKVLVAGGCNNNNGCLSSAELYDPGKGVWRATGGMSTARNAFAATLLPNGPVLVVGGSDQFGNALSGAELYNPSTGVWAATGSMTSPRVFNICCYTPTLLPNGQVLVEGGVDQFGNILSSAELYTPSTGTWTTTGSMSTAREQH